MPHQLQSFTLKMQVSLRQISATSLLRAIQMQMQIAQKLLLKVGNILQILGITDLVIMRNFLLYLTLALKFRLRKTLTTFIIIWWMVTLTWQWLIIHTLLHSYNLCQQIQLMYHALSSLELSLWIQSIDLKVKLMVYQIEKRSFSKLFLIQLMFTSTIKDKQTAQISMMWMQLATSMGLAGTYWPAIKWLCPPPMDQTPCSSEMTPSITMNTPVRFIIYYNFRNLSIKVWFNS